jgi:hypothetical protein
MEEQEFSGGVRELKHSYRNAAMKIHTALIAVCGSKDDNL